MNSNHQSDDEDMFAQLVSKIQAQKVEIDSMHKQLRQMEFQYKQQIMELSNELEQERKRSEQLQKDMKSYINSIGNGELQTFAIEMESKLAAAENAILEHKQNEMKLHSEVQKLRRRPDNEEIDDLKQQLIQMEEGAVGIIMEKEKLIQNLKDQLSFAQEQHTEQYNQPVEDQDEKDQQICQLKELVQQLNFKMEQEQLDVDERLIKAEHEVTQRLLDGMSHQINQSKDLEQDLLDQINLYEEKIKHLDKMLQDQDKYISQLKEEHNKENTINEQRMGDLQKRQSASMQQVLKSDKKSEEALKQVTYLQRDNANLDKRADELLKSNVVQDNLIRKLNNDINELQKHIDDGQQQIEQLEHSLHQSELRFQQMALHYQQQLQIDKITTNSHGEQQLSQQMDEQQGQGGNLLSELLSTPNHDVIVPPSPASKNKDNYQHYFSSSKKSSVKRKRMEDPDIELLHEELFNAKQEIQNLSEDVENYELTIEVLQKEIKQTLLELQNLRKSKLDFVSDRDLKVENEELKQHLHKLETHYISTKLGMAEEVDFLKRELKINEKDAMDSKTLYIQVSTEKEYFQEKLRKLELHKKKKSTTKPIPPVIEEESPKDKKSRWTIFK